MLNKCDTDQMSNIWRDFSDKKKEEMQIFDTGWEYDFDITEEEGGPNDISMEKADYLDKLTSIISAEAQVEWEKKKIGFENLQKENDCILGQIRDKEKDLDDHKGKVDGMIDMKAKEIAKFIAIASQAEVEKEEKQKEQGKLKMEILDLENKISLNKEAIFVNNCQ